MHTPPWRKVEYVKAKWRSQVHLIRNVALPRKPVDEEGGEVEYIKQQKVQNGAKSRTSHVKMSWALLRGGSL
jgi:hypothetical protein